MRTWAAVVGLALLSVLGGVALTRGGDAEPGAGPEPLVTYSLPAQDHTDDYSAPASELIDHLDHLDLDRIPPKTRVELEAEVKRREAIAEGLWTAYGRLVTGDAQADATLVQALPVYELAYVLTAARAQELAAAVARTGSFAAARRSGEDHRDVTVSLVGECVTVVYAKDPFSRAFGVRVGPADGGSLRERLEQTVRVAAAGSPACGGSRLALSPEAAAALGG